MLIRLLFGIASLLALQSAVAAQSNEPRPFRLGISNDQSGPYADQSGPGSVLATRMAVKEFGGKVLGRPIEIIVADNQNKPDIAAQIARRWFDTEDVTVLVDGGSSAAGLAAQNVAAARKKITLMTSGTAPDFSGKQCSPYGTQWASSSYSLANAVVKDLVQAGGKTWFFLTTDFVFGHALEAEAAKAIAAAGGKVLGSARHPINTHDFSSDLLKAQASGADVIAVAASGSDQIAAIKQAREYQVPGRLVVIYTSQSEIEALGLPVARDLTFATPFYWDQNEKTREWANSFRDQHKKLPSMIHANTYTAVMHYLRAVEAAGTDDAEAVISKMKSTPVDTKLIQNASIMANGRVIMDMHIAKVKAPGESKYPGDSLAIARTLPAKEVFEAVELSGCPLLKP